MNAPIPVGASWGDVDFPESTVSHRCRNAVGVVGGACVCSNSVGSQPMRASTTSPTQVIGSSRDHRVQHNLSRGPATLGASAVLNAFEIPAPQEALATA